MGFIWTIVIGLVAGVIAKIIMPGPNDPGGLVMTALIGVAGAFVATFLGQALGIYGESKGAGLVGSVIGAIIVLYAYSRFAKPKLPGA
jgi:uncharacterized membrane protein YeaQ/YmgE (transglycosylase-associated protein family)